MSVDSAKFNQELQAAIDYAHQVTDEKGGTSPEAAAAWDVVEEMRAEVSHQHQGPKKTAFDQYLEDHPDAAEARDYQS
ncbi:MAG: Calvin cycle protein CP12 [Nodosilinea sp.]